MRHTLLPFVFVLGCSDYGLANMESVPDGESDAPMDPLDPPVETDTAAPGGDTGDPEPPADSGVDTGDPTAVGSVSGRICDPSGNGWVAGARVWVEVDTDGDGVLDTVIETTTDAQGYFVLEGVPVGIVEIRVEKGSFSTTITVEVTEGGVVLPEDTCLDDDLAIAVLQGSYDSTEEILDGLGLAYDLIEMRGSTQIDLLKDSARLNEYDIVFMNCGMNEDWLYSGTATVTSNLKAFVEGGSSLYASDWAFLAVESAFPNAIDFYGDDNFLYDAYGGDSGTLNATVVDPIMQALLGSAVARVHYDLAGWAMAEDAAMSTEVLVRGSPVNLWSPHPLKDVPLAVRFEAGLGRVVFTTFHNEPQITADMEVMLREIILSL